MEQDKRWMHINLSLEEMEVHGQVREEDDEKSVQLDEEEHNWNQSDGSETDRLMEQEYEDMIRELEATRKRREEEEVDDEENWRDELDFDDNDDSSSTLTDSSFASTIDMNHGNSEPEMELDSKMQLRRITGQLLVHMEQRNRRVINEAKSIRTSQVLKELTDDQGTYTEQFEHTDSNHVDSSCNGNAIGLTARDTLLSNDVEHGNNEEEERQKMKREEKRMKRRHVREERRREREVHLKEQREVMKKQMEEERLALQRKMESDMKHRQEAERIQMEQMERERQRILQVERRRMETVHQEQISHALAMENMRIMKLEERFMRNFVEEERQVIHNSIVAMQKEEESMCKYLDEERIRTETEEKRQLRTELSSMQREDHRMREYIAVEKRRQDEEKKLEILRQKEMERQRERLRRAQVLEEHKKRFMEAENTMSRLKCGEQPLQMEFSIAEHVPSQPKSRVIHIDEMQPHAIMNHLQDWQKKEYVARQVFKRNCVVVNGSRDCNSDSSLNVAKEDNAGTTLDGAMLELHYPEMTRPLTNITLTVEGISTINGTDLSPHIRTLQSLVLDQNDITSLAELPDMPKLLSLSMKQNRLSSFDSLIRRREKHDQPLMEIIVEQNHITNLDDSALHKVEHDAKLGFLRELNLSNNYITRDSLSRPSPRNIIHFVSGLQSLNLFHNDISGSLHWFTPWIASQLGHLMELDLAENMIDSVSMQERINIDNGASQKMTIFPYLQELILLKNNLSGDVNALQLTGNVLLRELLLSGNKFTSVTRPVPHKLPIFAPLLQILKLDSCGIHTLDEHCFISLINLTSLDLSFNSIDSVRELKCLKWCGKLKKIKVNDNPVSEVPGYLECLMAMVVPKNVDNLSDVEIDTDLMPRDAHFLKSWVRHLQICLTSLSPYLMSNFVKKLDRVFMEGSYESSSPAKRVTQLIDNAFTSRVYSKRKINKDRTADSSFATYRALCSRQLSQSNSISAFGRRFRHSRARFDQRRHEMFLLDKKNWFDKRIRQTERQFEEQMSFDQNSHPSVRMNMDYQEECARHIIRQWLSERMQVIRTKRDQLRNKSATKIQAIVRGHLTRLKHLGWILEALNRRHMAAMMIQRVFRGWAVRNIIQMSKEHNEREMREIDDVFNMREEFDIHKAERELLDSDTMEFVVSRERQEDYQRERSKVSTELDSDRDRQWLEEHLSRVSHERDDHFPHISSSSIKEPFSLPQDISSTTDPLRDRPLLPPIRQSVISDGSSSTSSSSNSDGPASKSRARKNKGKGPTMATNKKSRVREEELMKEWSITQEQTAQSLMKRIGRIEKMKRAKEKKKLLEKNPQLRLERFKKQSQASKTPRNTQKTIAASSRNIYQNRQMVPMYRSQNMLEGTDSADPSDAHLPAQNHESQLFRKHHPTQLPRRQYRQSNMADDLDLESVSSSRSYDAYG